MVGVCWVFGVVGFFGLVWGVGCGLSLLVELCCKMCS